MFALSFRTNASRRGYTLVESMAVLAIGAVLLAMGIPAYRDFAAGRALAATIAEFAADMKLARTEALRRGARVSLCRSDDGASCASSAAQRDWARGWLVFVDQGTRGKREPGDQLLRAQPAFTGRGAMTAAGSGVYVLSFLPSGNAVAAQNNFQLDPPGGADARLSRRLCITSTGAWRVVRDGPC